MIVFPNCKINLGLRVAGKRSDGYHDIETVFYPLSLKDALEINKPKNQSGQEFELELFGDMVPGKTEHNLCYKAWQLLKNDFTLPPLSMQLLKSIPTGAGLGGGSSDGAHALLLINAFCNLNLSSATLQHYALLLGSDCPFFIINKPCIATGRGEIMKEITLTLKDYYFVLVHPGIPVSTARAFEKLASNRQKDGASRKAGPSLEKIIHLPVSAWKNNLINDFEAPVFEEYEALKIIRELLYEAGAEYASLTGTGSCVYGIFEDKKKPDLRRIPAHYKLYQLK